MIFKIIKQDIIKFKNIKIYIYHIYYKFLNLFKAFNF